VKFKTFKAEFSLVALTKRRNTKTANYVELPFGRTKQWIGIGNGEDGREWHFYVNSFV